MLQLPLLGTFHVNRATAAGGTAFTILIPPFTGQPGAPPSLFKATSPTNFGGGVTHVSKVAYTTGATAHQIGIMRPFNYARVDGAVAANGTVINLIDNPGTYSTKYKYASPLSTGTAQVADNGIAANDYFAVQLADGTWWADLVTSVATLAITVPAIPNITGGGILDGALFYFFGVIGDKDPATGLVNPQNTIAASATRDVSWADALAGVVSALHPGDPLLFYSPNTTNAGVLEFISGYYGKY